MNINEDKIELKIKDYKIITKLEKEMLILEGESLEKFPREEYSNNYTLNDLKKGNKFFEAYDDIKKVYYEIQNSYNKKKLVLSTESDNLILSLPLGLFELEEIPFLLVKKPIDLNKAIIDLKEMNDQVKLDLKEKNYKKDQEISELKLSIIDLENRLNSTLKEHKEEIEKLKKDYQLQNNEIKSLKDKLKESKKMNNQKGEEIKRLNKELSSFKDNKNKEIKDLNDEVNYLRKRLNELEEKFGKDLNKHTGIIDIKMFYLREINAEEFKKNYKNSAFFKDIMNKYYSHISFLNSNWFFSQESKFNQSYQLICDYIFEELNEKNGKNGDKILEFDFNDYTKYTRSYFNCFYLKNTIHQLFYSDLPGTDEEKFGKIYNKIHEFLKLKEFEDELPVMEAKDNIREYFNTFKIFDIITLYKKLILGKK